MAKKKKPEQVSWNEIQYVINNLPDKDMEALDGMNIDWETINNWVTEMIEIGGRLTAKWEHEYGDVFYASLTFYDKGYDNTGYAISCRAKDFFHALTILYYKFVVVAQGELFKLHEARTTRKYG